MMHRFIYIIPLMGMLFSWGCSSDKTEIISGTIYMVGSAPHSYLALVEEKTKKTLQIDNPDTFDLIHRQREKVTIEVTLVNKAVGPGFPAIVHVVKLR